MLWGMDMIKKSEPLASEHGKTEMRFFGSTSTMTV
jgi:hypothetical protein